MAGLPALHPVVFADPLAGVTRDLPYGGRAFSMTVLLPRQGVSVDSIAATLDAAEWEGIADGFHDTDVLLFLPRFRMAYERTLNDDLAALGMVDARSTSGRISQGSRLSAAC